MSYKEQNEILQRIREVEKTINFNLTTITHSISQNVKELKTNFDILNSKIESLEINYNEYKLKVDKIDEFIVFKNKSIDQLTNHEIKINTLQNDFGNLRTKYDKLLNDNLTVPGYIGEFCRYKTIGEYLDFNIKELNSLNIFKNESINDLKNFNNKIDKLIKQFTNSLDMYSDRQINALNDFKNETFLKIVEEIKGLDKKFEEIKIINYNETKKLIDQSNELISNTKETIDFRNNLKKFFDDKMESFKSDFIQVKNEIIDFNDEYSDIKDKFNDIIEFINEFNYKKYGGKNIYKRDNKKHKSYILKNKSEDFYNDEKKSKSSIKLPKIDKVKDNNENKKEIKEKKTKFDIKISQNKKTENYIKKEDENKMKQEIIEEEKKIREINKKEEENKQFEKKKEKKQSNQDLINIIELDSQNLKEEINIQKQKNSNENGTNMTKPNENLINLDTKNSNENGTNIKESNENLINLETKKIINPDLNKLNESNENTLNLEKKNINIDLNNIIESNENILNLETKNINTDLNNIKEPEIKKESEIKIISKIEKKENKKKIINVPNDFEIQVTERFYTQPNYRIYSEDEEENTMIVQPKYLDNKSIKTPQKKGNIEKMNFTKRKQNSELIDNNFIESKKNLSPTKIMFKTIDSFNKDKYNLDKNFNEENEMKKKIINIKFKSKGDKSFGTTIIKDFSNKLMYNTNSYFYHDSNSNRKNQNENSGMKKKKDIIDCNKSNKNNKKRKNIINVSEIFYNKTNLINKKIDEICEMFKKNEY